MKETKPVYFSDYATSRRIDKDPAFAWCVPYTLSKLGALVPAVSSQVQKFLQKYRIDIPTLISHSKVLDKKNGKCYWTYATTKEMTNIGIAFNLLEEGHKALPGWTKASVHIVFDIKMNFTRKARWMKDVHFIPGPATSAYDVVVSRESVRVALTYADLMVLDAMAADTQNAYLQVPLSEKHYNICGPEFGLVNVGKVDLIKRALY